MDSSHDHRYTSPARPGARHVDPRHHARTLLVTLSGADRPGVTTELLELCAGHGVEVIDVGQVVLRGRLVLGALVTAPADESALRDALRGWAAAHELEVEVTLGVGDNEPRREGRSHVTVIAAPLHPAALATVTGRIAEHGGNIDRIARLAKFPVTALELDVSGVDPAKLREELAVVAAGAGIDVAVQPAGLHRRAKRLVVMDVDSTLIRGEVIELLAAHAGRAEDVARVTAAAMRGELDFAASLRERVAMLAGLDVGALAAVRETIELTPGARTLVGALKRLGYQLAIVSGGFSQITDSLAADLGIDYAAANTLEIADGRLTGRLTGPIVDRAGKARALERFAARAGVPLTDTVAIGDGANDLDMLATAGLGIAFNAKPVVRARADTAVNVPFLDAVLYLLGITSDEVDQAELR